jgi:hypothetical protein
MADGGAAYRRARDKQIAKQRADELKKLSAHNQRATGQTQTAVRRTAPGPEPPHVRTSPEVSWWMQPSVRALMARMEANTAKHPHPSGCPNCGGPRIRIQMILGDGNYVYHCPIDWGPTTLATGCGWRWPWSDPIEQRPLPE